MTSDLVATDVIEKMSYDTSKYICGIEIADDGLIGNSVGLDYTRLEFCDADPDAKNEKKCAPMVVESSETISPDAFIKNSPTMTAT